MKLNQAERDFYRFGQAAASESTREEQGSNSAGPANIRAAVAMAEEGLISRAEAILQVRPSDIEEAMSLRQEEEFRNGTSQIPWLAKLLCWARGSSATMVRANADTPQGAARARQAYAAGIGLYRTEPMFFAPYRLAHIRSMILATTLEERESVLAALLPAIQADFEELFRATQGLPVTIRLIDSPLHEFLPLETTVKDELALACRTKSNPSHVRQLQRLLARVQELSESNPLMGVRGCRLGILHPEILVMQVTAILRAALKTKAEGVTARPEIVVPWVACVEEIHHLRKLIDRTAREIFLRAGDRVAYRVGIMIESPCAAVCAGEIAKEVDFLSLDTNVLTQMTYGFSRDDSHKYLDAYMERGILNQNPFLTIDREGVGALIRSAIQQARAVHPAIEIGICGEHGGDPESIEFFETLEVDYISCSPARIPIVQLNLARATLAHSSAESMARLTDRFIHIRDRRIEETSGAGDLAVFESSHAL